MKAMIDGVLSPATVFVGSLVALTVLYLGRRWFVHPAVALAVLAVSLVFFGLSLGDPQFAAVALAPDNIPIVAMLYLLGFLTWLATVQAVENDRRQQRGEPPREKELAEKVFTWPDLVYSELICIVLVMAVLLAWSLLVPAPLEQPADPAVTPNPSKAPWYFLGIQELLFYGDPWLVGVAVPCLMVLGLMAVPYLDFNPEGSGYYTIARRRLAYCLFQFGFWQLWILLIVIGTFFRGTELEFLRTLRGPRPAKTPVAGQRPVAEDRRAEHSGDLFSGAAAASGPYRAGQRPPADGAPAFHGLRGAALVHAGIAVEDAPALDVRRAVHRRLARVVLQFLSGRAAVIFRTPAISLSS